MKMSNVIHSKKQKYNAALAMAVLMTLGGFTFGTNPTFAETTDKPVWVDASNADKYTEGITVSNADSDLSLVHMSNAKVDIKNINVKDSTSSTFEGIVVLANSKVASGEGVNISKVTISSSGKNCGLKIDSSMLEAPVISLDNITGNGTLVFVGLSSESLTGENIIKADSIHVSNITTDKSKQLAGMTLYGTKWTNFTEGKDNDLMIENIKNSAEKGVAAGINLQFPVVDGKPCSYDITGNTIINNIKSSCGGAWGIVTNGSVTQSGAYVNMHNMKISDIHGEEFTAGILAKAGSVRADNADINTTDKEQYDGFYASTPKDSQKSMVNNFAIYAPMEGIVQLDRAEGKYKINGAILSDGANTGKAIQISLNPLENPEIRKEYKENYGYTDETLDAMIDIYKNKLKNLGSVNLGGQLALYGDVYAKNGGIVNVNLTNGSVFEGQADNYADYDTFGNLTLRKANLESIYDLESLSLLGIKTQLETFNKMYGIPMLTAGKINLNMEDGSLWKAHGKSFVDTLNFKDGGLVDMRAEDGSSITAGKLTGNGTFIMNLSNNADKSDMLYVKDISEAGVQTIQANLKDGLKAEDLKGMRFATTGGDDYKRNPNEKFKVVLYKNQGVNDVTYKVSNEAFNVKNEKFDPEETETNEKFNGGKDGTGTYKPGNDYITAIFSGKEYTRQVPDYEKIMLAQLKGDNPYDDNNNVRPEYMKTEIIENPIKEGTNWYLDTAVNNTSNSGNIIKNAAALDYANAVTTDTLNKRLGEARYSNEGDGMWARVSHDRFGKTNRYEGKNTMTELGYDWKRCDTSYGKHMQGAAVNYTTGSADYKAVTGESSTKRYGLSFYDTQLRETGHYLDTVAKFGRVSNKFTLEQEDANNVNADYHNNYYALSFEYGRKNPLENNWYVEPQAQLQYTYLASTDYRTSQGTDVQLSGTDSLIGRVGFRIGRELDDKTTFYVDANAYHEFLGNQDILASDMTGIMNATTHNDGTWYEAGVGISGKLNKNTNGFVQFTKGFGSDVEHTWSFEGGLNFTF